MRRFPTSAPVTENMGMSDTPQFLDIVIFAMIAVFLGLRLRSVLGRRNSDQAAPPPVAPPDGIIDLSSRRQSADATRDPLSAGLGQIGALDQDFHPDQFLQGAQAAFEMIVNAFAAGDQNALRPLLSEKVYADFCQAIEARSQNHDDHRMTLVHIVSATLTEAQLRDGVAEIAVRFVSEQRGTDGHEVRLIDLWRFARKLGSRDPNWRLVATGTIDE
jgi:predicted lipid-binding transport protein (Tim44 family)